ncbi:MAG: hypothetical protein ACP5D6_04480 [Kosmotogaceae bacterium]
MQNSVELEGIVTQLPGVKGAKVVITDGGDPKEIHVLADFKKPAKQIVRDIETAIYAASGFRIDRKIVSVAQIKGEPVKTDHQTEQELEEDYEDISSRYSLVSIETKATRKKLNVTVTIDDDGSQLSGSSVVELNDSEKFMAVVEASVAALRQTIPSFRVDVVEKLKYGVHDVILVVCSAIVDGERKKEAGARFLRKDTFNDTVLAVLETLNKMN